VLECLGVWVGNVLGVREIVDVSDAEIGVVEADLLAVKLAVDDALKDLTL
jgi:hypothetical protein